jgi:hypothetical protein
MIEFDATIEEAPRGGAFVAMPSDVVSRLGEGGRIPVEVRFDGTPYRGSVVRMGGRSIVGVLSAIREELGKGPGDTVRVAILRDDAERRVEIPPELTEAFASSPNAREAFEALSYTHQREHVLYVTEAKKAETRARRAARTVERLNG